MKISNFRLIERVGTSALTWKFKALVEVETGMFFKKKEDKTIYKEYTGHWFFTDTGKYTPEYDVEGLQRKFESEQMKSIEECTI
ncbi:MAG: hypothetical protein MJK15_05055 [Colwellia sp.]|nr:hypothetical protein [Colwellia sp.]